MKIPSREISLLYVDDEELAREVMAKLLRLEGLSVLSAADGREALDLFKRHEPDIIVTDIRMPVMDGISMSREIRKISSKTPIIIASAYLQEQCLADLQSLGINSYIQKPIELNKLFSSIATCCECLRNFPKPYAL